MDSWIDSLNGDRDFIIKYRALAEDLITRRIKAKELMDSKGVPQITAMQMLPLQWNIQYLANKHAVSESTLRNVKRITDAITLGLFVE